MKSYIYRVPEGESDLNGKGACHKGLLIVLKKADYEENKDTLNGLLKAINHDENDCRVVMLESDNVSLNTEISAYGVSSLILMGLAPTQVGIMTQASPYFWYKLEKFDLLLSNSISELNADKAKKMNLWQNLQAKFLS